MIWAKEETMSRDEIEALQLERLKETVTRVYRGCMDAHQVILRHCKQPKGIVVSHILLGDERKYAKILQRPTGGKRTAYRSNAHRNA